MTYYFALIIVVIFDTELEFMIFYTFIKANFCINSYVSWPKLYMLDNSSLIQYW